MILIGVIFGFIVGLTSIGSGSLFAIAMLYLFRMKTAEVVGTDIAHAFLLVTARRSVKRKLRKRRLPACIESVDRLCAGCASRRLLFAEILTAPLQFVMAAIILISGIKLI